MNTIKEMQLQFAQKFNEMDEKIEMQTSIIKKLKKDTESTLTSKMWPQVDRIIDTKYNDLEKKLNYFKIQEWKDDVKKELMKAEEKITKNK